ncbi:TPA: hypothetical protein ACH3X1_011771 [Trebouxia sp. C0004]
MSDDGYVYEKDFVMLSVVDTSAPGLYLVEATSKTLLSRADPDEGDDDELEVRFGISHRNLDTNQRRKVQMSAQTQGLWVVQAKTLDEVDDLFCCNHVESNGIGKLCKVKLHQADAKVQDARRFQTLAAAEPAEPRRRLSFTEGGSSPRGLWGPLAGITAATYAPIDTAEELGEAVMTGEKRYLDRFAEASKRSASILAHDYGAEFSKQEEEHLSTLAHTLTGEWNPERSLGYSAEMLAKRASELYHAVGFHLGSKYKELVDKVDIALKTAIKEAKTDTSHGMPLLSEILSAFEEEQETLKGFARKFYERAQKDKRPRGNTECFAAGSQEQQFLPGSCPWSHVPGVNHSGKTPTPPVGPPAPPRGPRRA